MALSAEFLSSVAADIKKMNQYAGNLLVTQGEHNCTEDSDGFQVYVTLPEGTLTYRPWTTRAYGPAVLTGPLYWAVPSVQKRLPEFEAFLLAETKRLFSTDQDMRLWVAELLTASSWEHVYYPLRDGYMWLGQNLSRPTIYNEKKKAIPKRKPSWYNFDCRFKAREAVDKANLALAFERVDPFLQAVSEWEDALSLWVSYGYTRSHSSQSLSYVSKGIGELERRFLGPQAYPEPEGFAEWLEQDIERSREEWRRRKIASVERWALRVEPDSFATIVTRLLEDNYNIYDHTPRPRAEVEEEARAKAG